MEEYEVLKSIPVAFIAMVQRKMRPAQLRGERNLDFDFANFTRASFSSLTRHRSENLPDRHKKGQQANICSCRLRY
jgi:hypothetical protein